MTPPHSCFFFFFFFFKMDVQFSPLISPLVLASILLIIPFNLCTAQSILCRTSCGAIPIRYPFGIDEGCGSPYYRNLLACSTSFQLHLRTPSGTYPVKTISYADPHIVVSDPSMWSCHSHSSNNQITPFSLDTSTHFSLSPKNDYLFFNCSEDHVIVEPRPNFCERFPDRCDSACDSAGYLCRNLPGCPNALTQMKTTCCSYYPTATESLRLMLRHCASYTSLYWRTVGDNLPPYDQVPEYGIRIDFEIPVTTRCLRCEDQKKGGGTCGFDTESRGFLCLCDKGNATTYCTDSGYSSRHGASVGVIAGATTVVSVAVLAGAGSLVWYLRNMRTNKVVTCGVQSNDNRLF